jgi:putative PIN family toxin of toxin-antitoxin system
VKKSGDSLSVVLDTNILVSSLLSNGPPALIVDRIAEGRVRPCFDDSILSEYWDILCRPKFGFNPVQINRLVHNIINAGFGIDVSVPSVFPMPSETNRKFYDAAKAVGATLITGNTKHYSNEPFIMSPAQFLTTYQ